MTYEPVEVRFDPATSRVAIKTALESPRTWFVFSPLVGGGHYSPGTYEPTKVDDWLPYTNPATEE